MVNLLTSVAFRLGEPNPAPHNQKLTARPEKKQIMDG